MARLKKKDTENTVEPIKQVSKRYRCLICNTEKPEKDFYKNKNNTFIGVHLICKSCITDRLSKGNTTVREVLRELDIVYVESLWESCISGKSNPFGTYMRVINSLSQYKGLTYSDSDSDITEPKCGYGANTAKAKTKKLVAEDILKEEKKQYSKDWMGYYTPTQIEYLNNYISSLKRDFKIANRNHIDYAQKIAKASLAMDISFDNMMNGKGDSSKYKAMKETFDTLSKTAQFSENQRGASDVGLGSFGVIFDKVEQNAYVYEHEPEDKDIYDKLLEQFSNIKKSL